MVDTHCHLDSIREPAAAVVERARDAGVQRLASVGMHDDSIASTLRIAHEHEEVFAIVGRHPHHSEGFDDADLARIEQAAADDRVRAIGETGLDWYRDRAPRDDQRRAFEAQIDLAARLGLPLVIHTREAEEDTFAILRERASELTVVMHCFSAPGRIDECVELGYLCSFAGNVTYPKNVELQAAARDLPEELLLVETDSPYLAPQPVRGKPNEPAHVTMTAQAVAGMRGVPYEDLEASVERNAARVFEW
ncbi:MAG: TatD family hydrolase [Thermoleophilaceae bacterium]